MTPQTAAPVSLEALEQKWRDVPDRYSLTPFEKGYAEAMRKCADELATLRKTLAQQEAVAWEDVLRFDPGMCHCSGEYGEMEQNDAGDYVRYDDYEAMRTSLVAPVAHSPAGVDKAMVNWRPITTEAEYRAAVNAGEWVEFSIIPSDTYDMPACDRPDSGGWISCDSPDDWCPQGKHRAALNPAPSEVSP